MTIPELKAACKTAGLPLRIRKASGSMRGTLVVSSDTVAWSAEVADQMNLLGFRDFCGNSLTEKSVRGGAGWLHDYFRHSEVV